MSAEPMDPNTSTVPVPPELQRLLDRGAITWRQLAQLMGHPDMPRPALPPKAPAKDAPPHPQGPVPAGHRAPLTVKPAVEVEAVDEVTAGIIQQLYEALTALEADSKLLGVVGSWRDTLPDLHVLAGLRAWNAAAGMKPSMKQREPERQRGLLTDEEWAMVDEAAAPATAKGKGGQPS